MNHKTAFVILIMTLDKKPNSRIHFLVRSKLILESLQVIIQISKNSVYVRTYPVRLVIVKVLQEQAIDPTKLKTVV